MTSIDVQKESVQISCVAQSKILLHVIQYNVNQVHGLLLGSKRKGEDVLSVEDVVPICHSSPSKPILDIAFQIVSSYLNNSSSSSPSSSLENEKKLEIVGWYTVNERLDETQPGQAAHRIISTIASSAATELKEPLLIFVNSFKVASMISGNFDDKEDKKRINPFEVYGKDYHSVNLNKPPQWSRLYAQENVVLNKIDSVIDLCQKDEEDLPTLYDFESHMEEGSIGGDQNLLSRDWLQNLEVSKLIS